MTTSILATIMKRSSSLFVLLFIFSCNGPTQKIIDRFPNGEVMTEYVYANKGDTSKYTCKVYYENGRLKHETQVVSGMFVGEKKTFYENGKLQRIEKLSRPTPVDADRYDCYIINFRPDGTRKSEYSYFNNSVNGVAVDYDSTGAKVRTTEYKEGKLNGKETLYFPNGTAKSIAFVKDDTLRGFQIYFKENGDTLRWFHNGDGQNGIFYKKWLANGLVLTGNYGDSARSYVVWKWWDKTSRVVKSQLGKSKTGEYLAPE